MASHSLEKKRDAVRDVLSGEMSWEAAAEKHGVSKSTLSAWVKEAKRLIQSPPPQTPTASPSLDRSENRQRRLFDMLCDTLEESLLMLQSWAKTASDREFIEKNPGTAYELGKAVLERADTLVQHVATGPE